MGMPEGEPELNIIALKSDKVLRDELALRFFVNDISFLEHWELEGRKDINSLEDERIQAIAAVALKYADIFISEKKKHDPGPLDRPAEPMPVCLEEPES